MPGRKLAAVSTISKEAIKYLDLKHSLTETLPKLRQLENHLKHVLMILPR